MVPTQEHWADFLEWIIKMIEYAIEAALKSEWPTYKVGAAIFDRKKNLISIGWNKQKTHVKQWEYACKVGKPLCAYLHAEVDALIKVKDKEPFSIVIVRLTKTGLSIAKPCPICERAISETGIKKIYWTNREGVLVCQNV